MSAGGVLREVAGLRWHRVRDNTGSSWNRVQLGEVQSAARDDVAEQLCTPGVGS